MTNLAALGTLSAATRTKCIAGIICERPIQELHCKIFHEQNTRTPGSKDGIKQLDQASEADEHGRSPASLLHNLCTIALYAPWIVHL